MGFEYGYSVERPDALVLWEAQFGDFVNGAQTIIDEFISSSEQKWGQRSSVVLLLPHGYEGQGPDHSSARIERFLQMCAEDNMTVAYPSTPGVVLPPAAPPGLRPSAPPADRLHPEVDAAAQGAPRPASRSSPPAASARCCPTRRAGRRRASTRVLLASGKVVYDLEAEREQARATRSTAIVRVEQLAPLPAAEIAAALAEYPGAELVWVQDEPANQGAWPFMALNLPQALAAHAEGRTAAGRLPAGVGLAGDRLAARSTRRSRRRWSRRRSTADADGCRGAHRGRHPATGGHRRPVAARAAAGARDSLALVYFTDRGIEELASRRGEEEVTLDWLAEQLRTFVDLNPEFEIPIERLATWLARLDDDED